MACDFSFRDPAAAVAGNFVHDIFVQGRQLLRIQSGGFEPEGDYWKGRRDSQFEFIRSFYPFGKATGQLKLLIDQFLVTLPPVHAQGQPKLEGIHPPRPLCADAGVVRQSRTGCLRHVGRGNRERTLQGFGMAGQDCASRKRHGQPLVRIQGERIRLLNASHEVTMLVGKDRSRAIGAVHMQPEVVALTDL